MLATLIQSLDDGPFDPLTVFAIADYLEEQGQLPLAQAWRAIGTLRIHPATDPSWSGRWYSSAAQYEKLKDGVALPNRVLLLLDEENASGWTRDTPDGIWHKDNKPLSFLLPALARAMVIDGIPTEIHER